MEEITVRKAQKYRENPFFNSDIISIDKGTKQVIAGRSKNVLVNTETGETEGITLIHKFKEIDRESFVKLYVSEIQLLFELSKSGLKVFGYILNSLTPNKAELYIHVPDLMAYCNYKTHKQAYKGLSELIANKLIAMSVKNGWWFVNPNVVFNGDRIAFVKEYKLKEKRKLPTQTEMFKLMEQAREKIEEPPKD